MQKRSTEAAALALALALAACGGGSSRPDPATAPDALDDAPPAEVWGLVLQAQLRVRDGQYELAADALDDATRLAPHDPVLRLRHAEALTGAGAWEDALRETDLASELGAAPADVAPIRARALLGAERGDEAATVLRDAAAQTEPPEALFEAWFSIAREAGDEALAVEGTSTWVEAWPDSMRAWRMLGFARRDAGDTAGAAEAFDRAGMLPGGSAWDAEPAVVLRIDAGDGDGARDAAERCAARYRESIACRALRVTLSDEGAADDDDLAPQTRDAVDALANMTSGDRRSIAEAGRWLREYGRPALSAAYARAVAELRPFNVGSVSSAAWVASRAQLQDLAVELMQRVLEIDEANFDALNFIGYDWAERGIRLDEAELYIREALFLRPGDGNIMDSLAWVLFRQGRFEEALAIQLDVVARAPDNAVLQDHLGDILFALERWDEALQAWEYALQYATEYDEDVLDTVPAKIERVRELLGR